MCNEIMKKEVQEAIAAGERALQSLYAAEEKLKTSEKAVDIYHLIFTAFLIGRLS